MITSTEILTEKENIPFFIISHLELPKKKKPKQKTKHHSIQKVAIYSSLNLLSEDLGTTEISPQSDKLEKNIFSEAVSTKLTKLSSHEHTRVTTTQAKNWTSATLQFPMCLFPQLLPHCSYQKVSSDTTGPVCILELYISGIRVAMWNSSSFTCCHIVFWYGDISIYLCIQLLVGTCVVSSWESI